MGNRVVKVLLFLVILCSYTFSVLYYNLVEFQFNFHPKSHGDPIPTEKVDVEQRFAEFV